MTTERTFWKPLGIHHTVLAAEASSGIARVLVLNSVPGEATDEYVFVSQVKTSADLIKSDFTARYNVNSGTVDVVDGSDSLVTGDQISIVGMFYT